MLKAAGGQLIQCSLSGMAKRCMPQVMCQTDGFGQVFIQTQPPGNGPGDLGHLQRMGQPCTVEIPFRREEDLRLLFQPAECFAVDDPVPVPLVYRSDRVLRLRSCAAAAGIAEAGPGSQCQPFDLLCLLSHIHSKLPSLTGHAVSFAAGTGQPFLF